MRVIWLSNKVLENNDGIGTGTWLSAMADGLAKSGEVELGNISMGNVSQVTRQDYGKIAQWVIPLAPGIQKNSFPSSKFTSQLLEIIEEVAPNLVDVWGVEYPWGLLTARKIIPHPALLEMQGLKGVIAKSYGGGLTFGEIFKCTGIKEILRGTTISQGRGRFIRWSKIEKEIICGHNYITAHSDWMVSHVKAINNNCRLFRVERVLRDSFSVKTSWVGSDTPVIFCSAAYSSPFKGLHIAVRALSIIKQRFPTIQLHIAGAHQRTGLRRDGYIAWICREIRRLRLEPNVFWLGPLSAPELVNEMLRCSAVVIPSFIESYCLVLAEAMMLGMPVAISYTGGTSYLARDEESALFFPPGDEVMCAYQLERLLTDRTLSERIGRRAREVAVVRNNLDTVIKTQLAIYRQVIDGAMGC